MKVAIDGPAAAGKSTVAKKVANQLSYVYIDTGAMYRALTLQALREGIDPNDEQGLSHLAKRVTISFKYQEHGQDVFLNDENVSQAVRQTDVTNHVSDVAKHKSVRDHMVAMQRELAEVANVVMDGRDIGTYVLPQADVKVFLIASVEERAERRHTENLQKGIESDLEELKRDIERRDQIDSEREMAPLIQADDAIEIDTTSLSIDDVTNQILSLIQQAQ
ncbi:(d)CMP kinase [Alkalibacillus salilacus]|uniref:Cytidylate kinase n=1 Tax=Alkalibacillus salilacus TaxID=284582 RepID=A0ABT9VC00_9BACI|nr:(d)CMP kinase [Alkalibacillus salilacus]MDQ0158500.1 cytidylate kinase [Alkalibacillus salilacus]